MIAFAPQFQSLLAAEVGAALRAMRRRAGLSQRQVALRCHSYRPIIGRLERGLHVPSLETVCAYVDAVGRGPLGVVEVFMAVDRAIELARRRAA